MSVFAHPFVPAAEVAPRLAATVLVARDGAAGLEVLMVRRSLRASFMPGAYVFPGGAVAGDDAATADAPVCDETASALASRIGAATGVGDQAGAFAVAAIRECFEECGLWLGKTADQVPAGLRNELRRRLHAGEPIAALAAAAGAVLATSALQPWSRWVTPVGIPKRFDTLFFVAPAPVGQLPAVDAGETTELAWLHPPTALSEHARGALQMEFATVRTLESLAPFASGDVATVLAYAAAQKKLLPLRPRLKLDAAGRACGVLLPEDDAHDRASDARRA